MRALAILAVLLLLLGVSFSSAQTVTNSFNMQVYADGSAAIVQSITVSASDVSITMPLLSAIITDVVATDQNGSPLSFQILGGNITVYTIGATHVTIQYDTDSLTSKQGSVWTISFTTSHNLTVTLPDQSSLSSVSGTPISLSEQNGSPVVVVSPGEWSISYGVPIEAGETSTNSTGTTTVTTTHTIVTTQTGTSVSASKSSTSSNSAFTSTTQDSTTNSVFDSTTNSLSTSSNKNSSSQLLELVTSAVVIVAAGLGGLSLMRRRSNSIREAQNTELRPDDIQVLNYITEKGGKVFEQEIRLRFTLPKTSAWRQIKRLERLGYVKVYKVGSQNQIELLRKIE